MMLSGGEVANPRAFSKNVKITCARIFEWRVSYLGMAMQLLKCVGCKRCEAKEPIQRNAGKTNKQWIVLAISVWAKEKYC